MLEVLVVLVVIIILATIAVATFLGQDERPKNLTAQIAVRSVYEQAKEIYVTDRSFPSTDQILLRLQPNDTVYTYRSSLPSTSYSINPTDVAVQVDDPDMITICARAINSNVYCARYDQKARLAVAMAPPADNPFPNLFNPDDASARTDEPVTAYSWGRGQRAEDDALAALPSRSSVGTYNAGPGNTGQPNWGTDRNTGTIPYSAPLPPPAPPTPVAAPDATFTSTPPAVTSATDAAFTWTVSGGPLDTVTCVLDGVVVTCATGNKTVTGLSVASHSFSVTASGPGGNDVISYTWEVNIPPQDRLKLNGSTSYGTASLPSTYLPTGAFEVGAWVRLDALPAAGTEATIVANGCSTAQGANCRKTNSGWALAINSVGHVTFRSFLDRGHGSTKVYDETSNAGNCAATEGGDATPNLRDGKFHYIDAAINPAQRIRVYVDNKVETCSGVLGLAATAVETTQPLYIGAQQDSNSQQQDSGDVPVSFFNGAISEVRMTRGGSYALLTAPGPATNPPPLYLSAENGRPATFLYSFSGTLSDSAAHLGAVSPTGGAHLASSNE
jgi:type II secretory pathway pseudopilin PulG